LLRTEDGFDPTATPIAVLPAAVVAVDDPDDPIPQPPLDAEEI